MSTGRELYPEERREQILAQLNQDGRVSVTDLSKQFGVSEVTIRADLQALAEHRLVLRTHGGAVLASRAFYDISLAKRRQQQVPEKSRIGEAGAAMIANGDAIFLDSSSTALAIAQRLKSHHDLTIVTNSVIIAHEMLDVPGVTVVMPGGTLRRDTASLVGTDGLGVLHGFNIQKGFFGAHGISLPEGLTDVSADEAEAKRPMVAMCRRVVAVLDATKWGRVGLASFARPEDIDCIVTDVHAPAELVGTVRSLGIEVILV
jgi:DeoR family transcriptional regulator of aga operon/DeoR family fructose operon transcriptional repressor